MIAWLSGSVKFLFNDACILDVHGVGYKVFVQSKTRQLLTVGQPADFFIHTAVKDDGISLYGFNSQADLDFFELLLTVNGIGAKSALAVTSKISAEDFARAVKFQDLKTLMRLPGVGKKSAERILLELKDKVQTLASEDFKPAQIDSTAQEEAAEALEALGYSTAEISAAFDKAPENFSTEQLIKFALKNLSGR